MLREIKRYELQIETKLGPAEVDALTHQLFAKGVCSLKPQSLKPGPGPGGSVHQ